jgi:hypothetical protein
MDNAVDAFELRSVNDGALIRRYPMGISRRIFGRQVVFGEGGAIVVGGSLNGKVYVFDRRTGQTLDILQHAPAGFVQTITVRV